MGKSFVDIEHCYHGSRAEDHIQYRYAAEYSVPG
jgi:hypothetical protein